MINVTQVDERGNNGSKDGSTICDNYSRSSMPEDNFFKVRTSLFRRLRLSARLLLLHIVLSCRFELSICFHEQTLKSPKEINSNAMERSYSWRMGTKRPGGR
ncbi:hypothetical protein TNCV_2107691 [Trichonephila clavipes]|nr:hypothetical protein TNCV_2107691 [Trichonephila clavipes]